MSFENLRPNPSPEGYQWSARTRGRKHRSSSRTLKWLLIAIGLALVVHIALFAYAGKILIITEVFSDSSAKQWRDLERVTAAPPEELPIEDALPVIDPDTAIEPPEELAAMLDEMDVIDSLPEDYELDINPDVTEPKIPIQASIPAISGDPDSEISEPIEALEIEVDLPDTGITEDPLLDGQEGRVLVNPGDAAADEFDPDELTREIARKGLDTVSENGLPEGYTSIDDLLRLSGNALTDGKAMIGSDLLFAFNETNLRDSARLSLMKVAVLIDKNPGMFCWIEGHADLIGGESYNRKLSISRAQAVKDWLVKSVGLDGDRIIVIGKGQDDPIVQDKIDDKDAQAVNRRVEIKMRNDPPEGILTRIKPSRAVIVENPIREDTPPEPAPTRAERVTPPRAIPVDPPPLAEPVIE